MLLERLTAYARERSEGVPGFHREREFRWKLDVRTGHEGGFTAELTSTPDPERPKRGIVHVVPASTRTVGVSPNLGADDIQYVLGWSDEDSNPARVAQCHAAFVGLIERWAAAVPVEKDRTPHVLIRVYRSGVLDSVSRPEGVRAKDGVVIAVDGRYVHESLSVGQFWREQVGERKGSGSVGLCMICGQESALANTIPVKVPASLVPGASNDAALVSVNERVFGYDLSEQLTHIPVCLGCADDLMAGLTSVLSSRHSVTFPGQNTRLAWWVTGTDELDHLDLVLDPNPDEVEQLFTTVHRGQPAQRLKGRFCWLAVGGNVARIMVREFIDIALATRDGEEVSHDSNILAWFADHKNTPRHTVPYSLAKGTEIPAGRWIHGVPGLAAALGRWDHKTSGYRPFGAKNADRPDNVVHQLLQVAVLARPMPTSLRAHLIHRVRNDGRIDDRRAALARLALTRNSHPDKEITIPMSLDETCTEPAYVAGRLFAALESTQRDAHRPTPKSSAPQEGEPADDDVRREVNSTFGDRFLRRAIDTPRPVLVQGRKQATAWITKLRRRNSAAGSAHTPRLTALYELLDHHGGAPMRNTLRQQEQFILGYHHQLAHDIAAARAKRTARGEQN
ncbi:CRISPR-associated protein Csd1 [Nocardia amikacinitolerans]|uniref:type I-C CRISPR-associated protein Cas8c/Csd1 n=1 Tax=Nocardia amikacinitolerans TaxID=756689 RepID=UPI00082A4D06|nr:type I-C CRISPR-associated protein Cas8c/Csd1 [Nocardia amikacinitolerans]MCP2321232.1 CRISPR-associated protein Csd1 [Nocardia amikacinitolerans]